MQDFKIFSLGELVNIKYGKNQKKVQSDSGKFPIYGTGGLMGFATKFLYDKPSVLIGRKGSISKVKFIDKPFWTVDTLFYTEINENLVVPRFLYYSLSMIDLYHYNEGTTIPSLRTETLNKLQIKLPPLEVQKKIAAVLSCLDDKIALNNKINKNLEQQAQAIFKNFFITNFNPAWKVGTFSEIFISTFGGDWGKEILQGNYVKDVYCIRGADIPEINLGNKGKIPVRFILQKNFKKKLSDGDIVIEISGGSPTQSTGRVSLITNSMLNIFDKELICTNFCRAIKIKFEYSYFAYYYLKYLYDKNIFFSYENGTTGIKNLNLESFTTKEEIFLPPYDLIKKFNSICGSMFEKIFSNSAENKRLAEMRDLLLPRLLNGEIDASKVEI